VSGAAIAAVLVQGAVPRRLDPLFCVSWGPTQRKPKVVRAARRLTFAPRADEVSRAVLARAEEGAAALHAGWQTARPRSDRGRSAGPPRGCARCRGHRRSRSHRIGSSRRPHFQTLRHTRAMDGKRWRPTNSACASSSRAARVRRPGSYRRSAGPGVFGASGGDETRDASGVRGRPTRRSLASGLLDEPCEPACYGGPIRRSRRAGRIGSSHGRLRATGLTNPLIVAKLALTATNGRSARRVEAHGFGGAGASGRRYKRLRTARDWCSRRRERCRWRHERCSRRPRVLFVRWRRRSSGRR